MTGRYWGRSTVCGLVVTALLFGNVAIARAQTSTVPCYSYDENCKSIIKKTAIVGGVVIGAIIVWKVVRGSHKRAKSNAAPDNLNVSYEPTTGTADMHMVMSARANCPGRWSSQRVARVSGRLPPGLLIEGDSSRIAGTPLASGVWQADIEFIGLACEGRNGKTRTYGDRIVRVMIRIE